MPNERKQDSPPPTNVKLVLGYLAIKDLVTLEERVGVLARLDYENREIAQICNTTPMSVSVRKAAIKKAKNKNKKPRKRAT